MELTKAGKLCRSSFAVEQNGYRTIKVQGFLKASKCVDYPEILFAWLAICVRNTYEPAFEALEGFLCRQGRRKFLQPLYQALWENPTTQALAKAIYGKARAGYHPLAVATIDGIIKD